MKRKYRRKRADETRTVELIDELDTGPAPAPDLDTESAIREIADRLPEIQRRILELRQRNMTWDQIGREVGLKRWSFELEREELRKALRRGL